MGMYTRKEPCMRPATFKYRRCNGLMDMIERDASEHAKKNRDR